MGCPSYITFSANVSGATAAGFADKNIKHVKGSYDRKCRCGEKQK